MRKAIGLVVAVLLIIWLVPCCNNRKLVFPTIEMGLKILLNVTRSTGFVPTPV